MNEIIQIVQSFPFFVPSFDLKEWNGLILLEGEEIPVKMLTPNYSSLKDFSLFCLLSHEKNIRHKLKALKMSVHNENGGLLTLLEYLSEKRKNVGEDDENGSNIIDDSSLLKLDYYLYNQILKELKQIETENILTCSEDLKKLILKTTDIRGVEHRLEVSLPYDYPNKRPIIIDADLPEVALSDLLQAETLVEMFTTFKSLTDSYQDFWKTYNSLVKNTWIIDPEHPCLKDVHCRIIIGENVSILITLNPLDVNTCPDIRFLGPENAVNPYINMMENKLKTFGWNEDLNVHDNLLCLLDLEEFPQPPSKSENVFPLHDECSICFTVRLNGQTMPTKLCNNTKCTSYFHISCLAQWFQAVPTNETSFNLISGECPSCGEKILCPIKGN